MLRRRKWWWWWSRTVSEKGSDRLVVDQIVENLLMISDGDTEINVRK
jgi:hypothetical protein